MHRYRTCGGQELYLHDVAVLELVHFGTDPRILGVALSKYDDRRLPMTERGDGYRAGRHYLPDDVHVRAAPSIDSAIRWNCEKDKN